MVLGNMDVGLNTQNLVAIVIVVFLSVLNIFGVRTGALVQNVFTFAKTAALLGLVLLGVFAGTQRAGHRRQLRRQLLAQCGMAVAASGAGGRRRPDRAGRPVTIVAVAQVGSLFSSDAWNNVTFTAGEVKNPQRNLPLALALGTGAVTLLYVLANFVYLRCCRCMATRTEPASWRAAFSSPRKTAWPRR